MDLQANAALSRGLVAPRAGTRIPASCNALSRGACKSDWVTRCLIVDDSKQFLAAARLLLERQGLTVVGVALTSAEALQQVELLRPEVVLVDVSLGEESGFDLARRLIEGDPGGAAVIMISTRGGEEVADLVERSRPAAFLPKSELSAGAILRLADGQGG